MDKISKNEQHNILSLLPYSPLAQLINKHQKLDDLYFIKSVIDFSITALEHFVTGELDLFDATEPYYLASQQVKSFFITAKPKKRLFSM